MMEAPIDDQVAAAGNGPKGYVVFCINRGTPFDVRYAPDSSAKADIAGLPRWANSGSRPFSFDHLVGAPHQTERDGNAKGLRSLEVDD